LILFDCPPVLAVSDAAQVCEIADAVLFLVRWKSTPVKAAQFALDNLRAAGARIVGVTLSQVNLRAQTRHGDALSYYRSYAEYHAR
jgi:succinoglycan biosynthesis transport protein ExoP